MRCLGRYHWKEGSSAMNFLKFRKTSSVVYSPWNIGCTILMSPNFLTVRTFKCISANINQRHYCFRNDISSISGDFDLSVGSVMAYLPPGNWFQSRGILTACIIAVFLGFIGCLMDFL